MITSLLYESAPLLSVSTWVQGQAANFDTLLGKVVLVEVFQVNCPGCFLYSLPEALRLHQTYASVGLVVLGVATAFEDFDKNTLENLERLVKSGEVVGDTLQVLTEQGLLNNGCLPYRLPFPIAMDRLIKRQGEISLHDIQNFINHKLPDFIHYPASEQHKLQQQVKQYLETVEYYAETFERFHLQGTPSHILVDKQGLLRGCRFGAYSGLEGDIQTLLQAS